MTQGGRTGQTEGASGTRHSKVSGQACSSGGEKETTPDGRVSCLRTNEVRVRAARALRHAGRSSGWRGAAWSRRGPAAMVVWVKTRLERQLAR